MDYDINYYRAIQGTIDVTSEPEYKAEEASRRLQRQLESSINYCTAIKNGVEQNFVITASEVKYKYDITAMPDDELNVGDMIEYFGEHLLVVQTREISPIQVVGQAWLCNYKMRYQNFSSDILEQWCVFDSGQYSSTRSGNSSVMEIDATRKIYMTSNDNTEKIFVDKRVAVDVMYNQYGEKILECYEIVGRSRMSKTYGLNAHMITFTVETSLYNENTDNIEKMICDYISPSTPVQPTEKLLCEIKGRSTIPIGLQRTYTAVFYDSSGESVDVADIKWTIDGTIDHKTESDNKITIYAKSQESYIGSTIKLKLSDSSGAYEPYILNIEVVS